MLDRFGALMRVMVSALRGKSFLWLNAADRARSANALDDEAFLKWGRWATAIVENSWMKEADKKGRDFDEVLVMHSSVALACMVLRTGQTKMTATVNGCTYAGKELGDWQVIIERIAPKGSAANAIDDNRNELLDHLLAQIDVWPGSIDGRDMLATHNTANLLRDLWHAIELLNRTLGYRDCQIKALHQVVAERDAEIARLTDALSRPPWTCFHCGETFTDETCARLHFGRDERSEAACIIKAGAEGSLLKALRDAEYQADDAIQAMHNESTDSARAFHQQRCRHAQALIAAEELGYERGLRDARAETMPTYTGLQEAVRLVIWEAWRLLDETANDNPPEVPQDAWDRLAKAMDDLEAIIPEAEQPCYPSVAARLLAGGEPTPQPADAAPEAEA